MAKKSKVVEAVEGTAVVTNWELTGSAVVDEIPAELGLRPALYDCWSQVDADVREDNPVWHFAYCDDHCTFIFRDGRKIRVDFKG